MLHHPEYICTGPALYCHGAQMILHGKLPYVDFVDILPPYVFYWFLAPALLANLLEISLPITVLFFTWLLIVYSLFCSFVVLRCWVKSTDWVVLLPLLFGFSLFNLPVFFHLADKEHIFVLAFMPFFLMRWLRQENKHFNRFFSITVGALLGMVSCFKPPQFFTLAMAPELYWWAKNRSIIARLKDPEIVAYMATVLANAVAFLILAPGSMRDAFLTRWMPLTLAGYGAYFCSACDLFLFTADLNGPMIANCWMLVATGVGAFIIRKQNSLLMPLLVWTTTGWFVYLIQQKGWTYQTIPMLAGCFMLASLELALLAQWLVKRYSIIFEKLQSSGTRTVLVFSFFCGLLSLFSPLLIRDSFTTGAANKCLKEVLLKTTHEGDPVLILTVWVRPAYPLLVESNRRSASRYLWTYPLKMYEYLKYRNPSKYLASIYEYGEETVVGEIFEDIRKSQPHLIAIVLQPLPWDKRWSMISLLERHEFNKTLSNYRSIGLWNNCMVWVHKA